MLPLAHIAGIPVEETLVGFAPVGALMLGAVLASASTTRAASGARTDPLNPREVPMVTVGLVVPLHAKPGKEQEVEEFLKGGLALVEQEPATIAWFALRTGPGEYAIVDAFPDEDGRQAHLTGKVAEALMAQAPDLFAEPPAITQADVLAAKLP